MKQKTSTISSLARKGTIPAFTWKEWGKSWKNLCHEDW